MYESVIISCITKNSKNTGALVFKNIPTKIFCNVQAASRVFVTGDARGLGTKEHNGTFRVPGTDGCVVAMKIPMCRCFSFPFYQIEFLGSHVVYLNFMGTFWGTSFWIFP